MKLNSFKYPDGKELDRVVRLDPMKPSQQKLIIPSNKSVPN